MNNLIIRQLTTHDYEEVRKVDILTQKQYLGVKWETLSAREKETHLVSRKSEYGINVRTGYCFVASRDKKIIGFILAHETLPFPGNLYIRYIGITPEHQGHGIGLLLCLKLIKKAKRNKIKKITSCINVDNPRSIQLHKKIGFIVKDRKEATLNLKN